MTWIRNTSCLLALFALACDPDLHATDIGVCRDLAPEDCWAAMLACDAYANTWNECGKRVSYADDATESTTDAYGRCFFFMDEDPRLISWTACRSNVECDAFTETAGGAEDDPCREYWPTSSDPLP